MATFVLIHGAWHGGWCWKKVTPLLRAAGHEVYSPTLTGLGERAHLLSADIDLNTHIADIVNVLEYEDLRDVVLVGHSYGGMVIAGVADRLPGRVGHLIYLDAFVSGDDQAILDFISPEARAATYEGAHTGGDGWRIPSAIPQSWGVIDEADVRWMAPRVAAQPLKTFTEPLRLTNGAAGVPQDYILCAPARLFGQFGERAKADPAWGYHELPSGHDVMVTMPQELSALLVTIATTTA